LAVPRPREGGLRRGEFFGSPYYSQRAVFASPPSVFHFGLFIMYSFENYSTLPDINITIDEYIVLLGLTYNDLIFYSKRILGFVA